MHESGAFAFLALILAVATVFFFSLKRRGLLAILAFLGWVGTALGGVITGFLAAIHIDDHARSTIWVFIALNGGLLCLAILFFLFLAR